MGHDQRFKEFLQTFLQEFLRLFFPDLEQRLDFRKIEFLDKEVFTNLAEGSSRRADVVAKLTTHDGLPKLLLVHIEIQANPEKGFPERMCEYYSLLRSRYKIPVFPVVIYLHGGKTGLTSEEYVEHVYDYEIQRFRFQVVQLARLDVEEYRKGVGPVGAALGALMDSSRTRERAELKASLLLQVIESEFDEARQLLLANIINTYLELSPGEWERYRKVVKRKEYRKVQDVDETWMDKLLSQGEKKGREEGLHAGHEVGREEGLRVGVMEGKRQTLFLLMERKFGPLPEGAASRVRSIESVDELDRLLDLILIAENLGEMKLDA